MSRRSSLSPSCCGGDHSCLNITTDGRLCCGADSRYSQGKPATRDSAVDLETFEQIVEMSYWATIERRFGARRD